MVKKISSKNTKAEILEAFEDLRKQNSSLELQIKQIEQATNLPAAPTVTTPQKETKNELMSPKKKRKTKYSQRN